MIFIQTLTAESCPVGTHLDLLPVAASSDLLVDELGAPLLVVQVRLLPPRLLLLEADGLRVAVDVLDVPAFGGLVDLTETWQEHPAINKFISIFELLPLSQFTVTFYTAFHFSEYFLHHIYVCLIREVPFRFPHLCEG